MLNKFFRIDPEDRPEGYKAFHAFIRGHSLPRWQPGREGGMMKLCLNCHTSRCLFSFLAYCEGCLERWIQLFWSDQAKESHGMA